MRRFTRPLAPVLVLGLLLSASLLAWVPSWGDEGIPTSVGLLYFPKKNFKVGDWALYRVRGKSLKSKTSTDYQRVQIGGELMYRGEPCFWLETGWGTVPEKLSYSAVLVSEGIYEDDEPEMRPNVYVRRMHSENTESGIPIAVEMRSFDPKTPLPDMSERKPKTTVLGMDTLQTAKGRIVCQLIELTRTYRQMRDTADSTMRFVTESKTRRWLDPDLVPITGLVREVEHKTFSRQVWPVGKPSTDYPMLIVDTNDYEIDLLDFGHKAKPQVADRVRDADEFR